MNLHSKNWQERLFLNVWKENQNRYLIGTNQSRLGSSVVLSFGEEFWTKYEW
jgi:hypothetical protein